MGKKNYFFASVMTLLFFETAALTAEPRAKATTFQLENGALKLPGPVIFETASDKLSPQSDEVLFVVQDYLEAKPYVSTLRIEGHTDSDGNASSNQLLSEKRALSIGRWLIAHGISCSRLLAVGFGGSKPVASEKTPEGKAQNRRIAFVNAALRGHAIGGMPLDGGGRIAGDLCK